MHTLCAITSWEKAFMAPWRQEGVRASYLILGRTWPPGNTWRPPGVARDLWMAGGHKF